MDSDKMTQELIRKDLPLFLTRVGQLQELQEQTAATLRLRDEKIRKLEQQLSTLQNEYLVVTLQQSAQPQETKHMLLSCLQSTSFALAHSQNWNQTTQVQVLHAVDELLQEMVKQVYVGGLFCQLDGEVEQKILNAVATVLGNTIHDPASILAPPVLAATRGICSKLALIVAIIPHALLDEVIPVLCFVGKSSWGTSVLLESNVVAPLLTIVQHDSLKETIPTPTYLKLLTLMYHLLQVSGFAAMRHQSQDATFRMFKNLTNNGDRRIIDLARKMLEDYRRSPI
ncbi:hypothetical protein LEN26_009352 [Aphanomyces euteiches]|nr:hypothetical protein AeMF1_009345 [Aphanomyces euteiches]KAH9126874.1 hypothetical protein LEN26_009352 [Aphanomyces euteiches]KAH9197821.1 hypothetical protein AeNC1_000188 [Aphanomyces euteiches]